MPVSQSNLHGGPVGQCRMALLLIDVISAMDFEGGEDLAKKALPAAREIASLKSRAVQARVPVIYVNDNFGRWQSDFRKLIRHCLSKKSPGREIVNMLAPGEDDYFVLKPRHSGFFSTTLDVLLGHLGASDLVLTGFAGNLCVLFTANDAYMRDYRIIVSRDCTASETHAGNRIALRQMRRYLKAATPRGRKVALPEPEKDG